MLSIKKVSTQNEFSRLKGCWTALLKRSKSDTVFLAWEWMYTWWECFKENKQLFVLTVYDENENLVGIAPLCMDKKNRWYSCPELYKVSWNNAHLFRPP